MDTLLSPLKTIWRIKDLRRRLIFTALIIAVFRLVAHIPTPGINVTALKEIFNGSAFLSLLDVFSGGTLGNFSIMALGLNPYINASIIIQMLGMVVPKLEELQKEGDYGRQKLNQYTRLLTLPLCFAQAFAILMFLGKQNLTTTSDPLMLATMIFTLSAGTSLLIWLGEQLNDYGLGNGISMIIFVGIVTRLPVTVLQTISTLDSSKLFSYLIYLALTFGVIYLIIRMSEATREVPIQSARRGASTFTQSVGSHLPLRLNQAGVIPIIFAVSFMLLPGMFGKLLSGASQPALANIARAVSDVMVPENPIYNIIYFILVVAFTFFYTAIVFNPEKIAKDLRTSGSFIPGVRPGQNTIDYLNFILTRITLVGASFLGLVAILPSIISGMTGVSAFAIGGTGILIVVSVILEILKAVNSQAHMYSYDKFLD